MQTLTKTYYHGTTREYFERNMVENNGFYTRKLSPIKILLKSMKDKNFAKDYAFRSGHMWLADTAENAAAYAEDHAQTNNETPILLKINYLNEKNGKLVCNGAEIYGDYYLQEGNLRPEQVSIIELTLEQAHDMAYGKKKLEEILNGGKK